MGIEPRAFVFSCRAWADEAFERMPRIYMKYRIYEKYEYPQDGSTAPV